MAARVDGTRARRLAVGPFRGVFTIPVTPFDERGDIDFKSLARCVEFCVEA
jgi:dihydrodipicolinate synthase/N-acetylneuraminate lyase